MWDVSEDEPKQITTINGIIPAVTDPEYVLEYVVTPWAYRKPLQLARVEARLLGDLAYIWATLLRCDKNTRYIIVSLHLYLLT